MMIKFILICGFGLVSAIALAQDAKVLKSADDLGGILGDKKNSVTKATVQTETEKTASVQIEYTGFKDKEKAYKIRAVLLGAKKTKVEEIEPVEIDLDPKAGLADIFFTFKQKTGKTYANTYVETSYLQVSVTDKKSISAQVGGGLEELGIDGKTFLFEYKKKWKIKGGANTAEVTVKLTPYKSAATIKQ